MALPLPTTVEDHVPRPSRTAAFTDGPEGDQPTTAIEPSREAARLGTQVEAHGPRLAGGPHGEPAGRVAAWTATDPLVGSFTAQAAVTLPDVSEAMESGPTMPAVSMSLGLPHAPPTGRVAALTVVLASQTTVALPDPSSATRGPDACDRTGEAAMTALQLPPAGRVADST